MKYINQSLIVALVPDRVHLRLDFRPYPTDAGNMIQFSGPVSSRAKDIAKAFGLLVRSHRQAMNLSPDQLALLTGVGRRFIIDLEAGKPSPPPRRRPLLAPPPKANMADILPADRGGARRRAPAGTSTAT